MSEEARQRLERLLMIETCLTKYIDAIAKGIGHASANGSMACMMEAENTHDVLRAILRGDIAQQPSSIIMDARNAKLDAALKRGPMYTTLTISITDSKAQPPATQG